MPAELRLDRLREFVCFQCEGRRLERGVERAPLTDPRQVSSQPLGGGIFGVLPASRREGLAITAVSDDLRPHLGGFVLSGHQDMLDLDLLCSKTASEGDEKRTDNEQSFHGRNRTHRLHGY